jgi:hypothetical protein
VPLDPAYKVGFKGHLPAKVQRTKILVLAWII